jgi:hypothetical protein
MAALVAVASKRSKSVSACGQKNKGGGAWKFAASGFGIAISKRNEILYHPIIKESGTVQGEGGNSNSFSLH